MAGVVLASAGGRAEQGSLGRWTGMDARSPLSPYWTLRAAGREPHSGVLPQGHGTAHVCGKIEPAGHRGGLRGSATAGWPSERGRVGWARASVGK